jgi:archaellum component FlaF (FlaF/FlaG flagellin family)
MGLSVVISGAIIMIALMFVLYSIPPLITSVTSVGETSTEISDLENTILQTEITLDSLAVSSSMPSFSFNLNNINTEKLWDYDNFDVLVTYDADISGKKTSITEIFPYKPVSINYTFLANPPPSTTPDTSATGAYEFINDMRALGVSVASADSHILFHANVSLDSDAADSSCRVALFVDGAMVAEAEDAVDTNTFRPANIGLTWWVTGLNPLITHDFEVMWLEQQTGCIVSTTAERSMQVIEFTSGEGVPTILTEVTSSSGESYPTSYQPVGGMRGSPDIDGPDSILFTTGTVSFEDDASNNASCYLGIFIDNTLQAEQRTYVQDDNEGSSVGLMWTETGLSSGSHTFELQARELDVVGCETDTAIERHMQVVDFTSGNPTILAEEVSNVLQQMEVGYLPINNLFDTVTIDGPGSVVLFTATVTFDAFTADAEGDAALFIDGNMVAEGRTFIDATNDEPGHVNLHWWATGLSAGNHLFEVMGKEGQNQAETDTETQHHMQVVEFTCTKQWNVVNISNDVLDPGIINSEETAKIAVELCNPIFPNGNVVVSLSTDNGVTGTISGTAT